MPRLLNGAEAILGAISENRLLYALTMGSVYGRYGGERLNRGQRERWATAARLAAKGDRRGAIALLRLPRSARSAPKMPHYYGA